MLLEAVFSRPAGVSMLHPPLFKTMAAVRPSARVFKFDEAASALHGKVAIETADVIVRNEEFAIPPFDNCYIEIDNAASLRAGGALRAPDAASSLGYWFLGTSIFCLAGDEKEPYFVPFAYHRVGTPLFSGGVFSNGEAEKGWRGADAYAHIKGEFFLGQIASDLEPHRPALEVALSNVWEFGLTKSIPENAFEAFFRECTGGLKRALTAVLLLNQPSKVVMMNEQPPLRKIVGGKQRVYMRHSVVTINLGPKEFRKSFHTGTRESPCGHEVRGDYVHRYRADGCSHEWVKIADPARDGYDMRTRGYLIPRWKCQHCPGIRSWRKQHERGDASKGWMKKDYAVTVTP